MCLVLGGNRLNTAVTTIPNSWLHIFTDTWALILINFSWFINTVASSKAHNQPHYALDNEYTPSLQVTGRNLIRQQLNEGELYTYLCLPKGSGVTFLWYLWEWGSLSITLNTSTSPWFLPRYSPLCLQLHKWCSIDGQKRRGQLERLGEQLPNSLQK